MLKLTGTVAFIHRARIPLSKCVWDWSMEGWRGNFQFGTLGGFVCFELVIVKIKITIRKVSMKYKH